MDQERNKETGRCRKKIVEKKIEKLEEEKVEEKEGFTNKTLRKNYQMISSYDLVKFNFLTGIEAMTKMTMNTSYGEVNIFIFGERHVPYDKTEPLCKAPFIDIKDLLYYNFQNTFKFIDFYIETPHPHSPLQISNDLNLYFLRKPVYQCFNKHALDNCEYKETTRFHFFDMRFDPLFFHLNNGINKLYHSHNSVLQILLEIAPHFISLYENYKPEGDKMYFFDNSIEFLILKQLKKITEKSFDLRSLQILINYQTNTYFNEENTMEKWVENAIIMGQSYYNNIFVCNIRTVDAYMNHFKKLDKKMYKNVLKKQTDNSRVLNIFRLLLKKGRQVNSHLLLLFAFMVHYNFIVKIDIYTVLRMIRPFRISETQKYQPPNQNNIIHYSGNIHSLVLIQLLTTLGFTSKRFPVQMNEKNTDYPKCVDIRSLEKGAHLFY